MPPTRPGFRLAAALAVVLPVAAACGEDDPAPAAGGDTAGGTTAETGVTGATPATGSAGDDGMAGYRDPGGGGDDGGGGDVDVQANNFSFDPAELEFGSGEDITVKNGNANTPHTFTVDGTDVDVQLGPLESKETTLDLDPGTYDFHCELHPQMTGTLTIT
ncbi:MAG: cupredoxin domain-containing protein [Actinomycetota bacterium]